MIEFLWGTIAALCATAGLFFFKFWRRTHDLLFLGLTLGFETLALHWTGLALVHPVSETRHYFFFVRLLAFSLIIAGVIRKNAR